MSLCRCKEPAREGFKSCQRCADIKELERHDRRFKFKAKLVAWLGGKCRNCGLVDDCLAVYTVHHQNDEAKTFDLAGKGRDLRNWELIEIELERGNCVLLCQNCHMRVHWELDRIAREARKARVAGQ